MSTFEHLAMKKPTPDKLSKRFKLSGRISVLISISEDHQVTADWMFFEPVSQLTEEEEQRYLDARREMFRHLSTILGIPVEVFELHPDGKLVLGDVIRPDHR
jgi:hypothetical protein